MGMHTQPNMDSSAKTHWHAKVNHNFDSCMSMRPPIGSHLPIPSGKQNKDNMEYLYQYDYECDPECGRKRSYHK